VGVNVHTRSKGALTSVSSRGGLDVRTRIVILSVTRGIINNKGWVHLAGGCTRRARRTWAGPSARGADRSAVWLADRPRNKWRKSDFRKFLRSASCQVADLLRPRSRRRARAFGELLRRPLTGSSVTWSNHFTEFLIPPRRLNSLECTTLHSVPDRDFPTRLPASPRGKLLKHSQSRGRGALGSFKS
jgi:hypothetical protein